SNSAIDLRILPHHLTGSKQVERNRNQLPLEQQNQHPDGQRNQKSPSKVMQQLILVLSPMSLRHQAGGRHAQKAKGPENGVEKDAAHRHSTQRSRPRQMPRQNRIHRRKQRLGQIRKDQRDGEQENPPVPVG